MTFAQNKSDFLNGISSADLETFIIIYEMAIAFNEAKKAGKSGNDVWNTLSKTTQDNYASVGFDNDFINQSYEVFTDAQVIKAIQDEFTKRKSEITAEIQKITLDKAINNLVMFYAKRKANAKLITAKALGGLSLGLVGYWAANKYLPKKDGKVSGLYLGLTILGSVALGVWVTTAITNSMLKSVPNS